jgi:hypothetical protein
MSAVPPHIPISVVVRSVKASGMSGKAIRGLLGRVGILDRWGRYASVGRAVLRERLPDVYEDVYSWYAARAPERRRRPRSARESPTQGT